MPDMDLTAPQPINIPKGSNAKFYIFIGVLLILLILSIILNPLNFLRRSNSPVNSVVPKIDNPLISTLNATISGKVIEVSGKTLTVQNSQGVTGKVTAVDNVFINKADPGPPPSTPSSDLNQIKLNTDVTLFLSLVDGELKVLSISYLPLVPPVPDPNSIPAPASSPPLLNVPAGGPPVPLPSNPEP